MTDAVNEMRMAVVAWFAIAFSMSLFRYAFFRFREHARYRTLRSLVVLFAACHITAYVSAVKPQTNDIDRVDAPTYGLMSAYVPPEIGGLTDDGDVYSVSNVFFGSFGKTGDVVSAGITIGENSIGWGDVVRIYATDNLEHPVWTNAYEHEYEGETSLAVQFDMSQFPTSFLQRALFGLDYPQDSDGDSINDGDERYRYHSNPAKYDTDDDGLGDGDELRIGSSLISADTDGDGLSDSEETGGALVLTGSSMLWLDTSSCTEFALSYGGWSDDWNVPIPGGVTLAGSIYTNCNVNMSGLLSFGDGEVTVDACGRSLYSDRSWESKVFCGTVIMNGTEYFVVECRNLSTGSSGAAKLSCQIAIPKSKRDVIYVSYQRVDDGIRRPQHPLGVVCSRISSPFDGLSEYAILPPVGYRIPVASTTIKYIIGLGSDPTVYNHYEEPALPPTSNSNAYYTVDIVADDHAHIVFSGDGPSDLPDPDFWALPGDTNRVKLLTGKSYVANANVDISCIGASDTETVVSNVSERAISFVRPVRINAMEGNGLGFLMRVNPSDLEGEFNWTNSCCAITGNGREFWYVHTGLCTCGGCYVVGEYRYEGYSLTCPGGYCDCPHYRDEWPHNQEDDEPYAEGISVSFSAPAVIYEDAYENNPTSTVPRRSTQSTLSCVVHGGESGGTARFSVVNASKIDSVEGYLPDYVFVPPMQKLEFDVCYEGNEPSVSADDVVVTGTFTPRNGGTTLTDSDTLTSIRLSMTAVYEAPENPCTNRHVYGVGEKVRFDVVPKLGSVLLSTEKLDTGDVSCSYELFDGISTTVHCSEVHEYVCPISASYHPQIKLVYLDVEYAPLLSILEPAYVYTPEVDWYGCHDFGVVGQSHLVTTNYVGPMNVSFQGIMVVEVPCEDVIAPTGYFATENFTGYRSHTYDAEAGRARRIQAMNRWTADDAGGGVYPNWSAGRLEWKIPVGWVRITRDERDFMSVESGEFECHGNPDSRLLLIGGREDVYKQIMTIDEDGTAKVEKFGHWLSRGRHCWIILDGETKQWTHWF